MNRPSADGSSARVSDENLRKMLAALKVEVGETSEDAPSAFLPAYLKDRPAWGISLQLYELRSARNWGIGDFADLWAVCEIAGELGADFVGLSPLHAPLMADPDRCSPYEPSNRRYLNPIYIAVDDVKGFDGSPELETKLSALRHSALVDYKAVAEAKLEALRAIWHVGQAQSDPAFREFVEEGGEGLRLHALFETISVLMAETGQGAGWRNWPAHYQTPTSPQVKTFEDIHQDDIDFQKWLQWLAHVQLSAAKRRASQAGMRMGLYLDLAVGEALDGSATWSEPDIYVSGASIGNPPEPFATEGQDWRLAALLPTTIADGQPSPFFKLLAASMRYAGAIRIDHAAALSRLFLVPTHGNPADGAYVSYPREALLTVLAEASSQFGCVVIGEDLGNVPAGLRDELAEAQVLSYRILSYERSSAGFIAPDDYPELALACVSTHDHQTFNGWWRAADIEMRAEHGLVPPASTMQHLVEREAERDDLMAALRTARIIAPDVTQTPLVEASLVLAAYRFVAKTPSLLVAVRLADMTDEQSPTNIPGTSVSYPNWKPKLSVAIDALSQLPLVQELSASMRALRPK